MDGSYLTMLRISAFEKKNTFASVKYKDILSSDRHFAVPNKRVYVTIIPCSFRFRGDVGHGYHVSFFVFSFLIFLSLRSLSTVSNSFYRLL